VASRTDSRVVLDEMGADKLLGNGDMLFLWPGTSTLLRGQGTYLSDDEINAVGRFRGTGEQQFVKRAGATQGKDPSGERGPPAAQAEEARRAVRSASTSSSAKGAAASRCCSGRWASATAAPPG
jgi:DNA segregation ATPase FtsK/SpoIIIE-like protein